MMAIEGFNGVVPEVMKSIIEQKGLKQYAVASRAGMKPQTLNDILNHRRIIKPCEIVPIATALGISPNDLFKFDKPA